MAKGIEKGERLAMILEKLCDRKKTKMAERLGKSQQNMSALLNNGTWYDAVALKEAFPELSDEWLLTGDGEMLKENEDGKADDSEADMYEVNGE